MIDADALTVSHVTGELIHVLVDEPPGGSVGVPQPVLDPVAFLARPATIPRARAAETERKAISYHFEGFLDFPHGEQPNDS